MKAKKMKIGTPVVYRMQKTSAAPGQRAQEIYPQASGENYHYLVDKHWTVAEVHDDGTLTLVTRRGKQHRIAADDTRLRPANIWERWLFRKRFPQIEASAVGEKTSV